MTADDFLENLGSQWSRYLADAAAGNLVYEEGAALDCALSCANAGVDVRGVWSELLKVVSLPGLSALPSGDDLATVFNGKVIDLQNILYTHGLILDNMRDTFVASDNLTVGSEADSTAQFDAAMVGAFVPPEEIPPVVMRPSGYPLNGPNTAAAAAFESFGGQFEVLGGGTLDTGLDLPSVEGVSPQSVIAGENGDEQEWLTLYNVGNHIRSSLIVQSLCDTAAVVYWAADTLDTTFGTMSSEVSGVITGGRWVGAAAKAAVTNTQSYATEVMQQLTAGARALADRILYSAEWLNSTEPAMPKTETPSGEHEVSTWDSLLMAGTRYFGNPAFFSTETANDDEVLARARRQITECYSPNIEATSMRIPVLTAPQAPPGQNLPDEINDATQNPGGGGLPLGGGGDSLGSALSDLLGSGGSGGLDPTSPVDASPTGGGGDLGQLASLGQSAAQGLERAAGATKDLGGHPPSGIGDGARTTPASLSTAKGGGLGGGVGGGGGGPLPLGDATRDARLFPRALDSASAASMFGRAATMPMAGTPGSPGPAGAGARNGQNSTHERARVLTTTENLDEALGEKVFATRPVLEP